MGNTPLLEYVLSMLAFTGKYGTGCLYLKGDSSRNTPNFTIFKFYQNIHVHIAYCHCAKDQIEN